ncbi:Transcriptional corepressor LEUNIG-like protein [Drosera capensis]
MDLYIHDYFVRHNLHATAEEFRQESKVSTDSDVVEAPRGFLFEWWSVFWDLFIAGTDKEHSAAATFYLEMQQQKELQQHLQMERFVQQEMQILHQRQRAQLLNGIPNGVGNTHPRMIYGPRTASCLAAYMYEEKLRQAFQRDPLGGLASENIKGEMDLIMDDRAAGSEGPIIRPPGLNRSSSNATLSGHPLTVADLVRAGVSPQQRSMPLLPQHFHNLPLTQQDLEFSTFMDMEARLMMHNNKNMVLGMNGRSNPALEMTPDVRSRLQVGDPTLSHRETDIIDKQQMQMNNQLQQHNSENSLRTAQLSGSKRMVRSGSMVMDSGAPNAFHENDRNQMERKRKHPQSSTGPVNSSGTPNTVGPSMIPVPSTPTTHTPGDAMSNCASQHNGGSSKPSLGVATEGTRTSENNKLADGGCSEDDATADEYVQLLLSPEDMEDPAEIMDQDMDARKSSTFTVIASIQASTSKVTCCRFSSDGKLLATGGQDKKAVLWYTDSQKPKASLEEHSLMITDVCFGPRRSWLATSSFDKTVRVWDAGNTDYSLCTFSGHSTSVWSLDFHPNREDLVCSSDANGEIRYWTINNGSCAKVFQGGMKQVRFQPQHGKYLAAAAENVVSVFDVETQTHLQALQGHSRRVHSICWDTSGEFLASASEDLIRVWSFGSGTKSQCIYELNCNGKSFSSCDVELWNMKHQNTMTLPAHDGLISTLAASRASGLVASGSHDGCVKLWK